MEKHLSEEQIIGFMREAEAGMPVKELGRKHGFIDFRAAPLSYSRRAPWTPGIAPPSP